MPDQATVCRSWKSVSAASRRHATPRSCRQLTSVHNKPLHNIRPKKRHSSAQHARARLHMQQFSPHVCKGHMPQHPSCTLSQSNSMSLFALCHDSPLCFRLPWHPLARSISPRPTYHACMEATYLILRCCPVPITQTHTVQGCLSATSARTSQITGGSASVS